eukprot:TRINITY_DN33090_c0_g1_i1.p1 TRINITY_DN33090_c0_g1~~TRINITY_DN33090_c0_g1_i1.p1  ORF type:complete len:182 (+),score=34.90 TRINITY_DN33090_c0_g1_i1:110-655(+)
MVQNEGRVQNGLFGMPNNQVGQQPLSRKQHESSQKQLMSDGIPSETMLNCTTTSSSGITPSIHGLSASGARPTNTDTASSSSGVPTNKHTDGASSSSPLQFNASSLGDAYSYQNSSATGASGCAKSTRGSGGSGEGSNGSGNEIASGGSGSSGGDGSGNEEDSPRRRCETVNTHTHCPTKY